MGLTLLVMTFLVRWSCASLLTLVFPRASALRKHRGASDLGEGGVGDIAKAWDIDQPAPGVEFPGMKNPLDDDREAAGSSSNEQTDVRPVRPAVRSPGERSTLRWLAGCHYRLANQGEEPLCPREVHNGHLNVAGVLNACSAAYAVRLKTDGSEYLHWELDLVKRSVIAHSRHG